jgi:hypothetical protein
MAEAMSSIGNVWRSEQQFHGGAALVVSGKYT